MNKRQLVRIKDGWESGAGVGWPQFDQQLMAVMDKRRFDVRMSPELADQFNETAALSGLSRAEVFRRAIALYERAKRHERSGGQLLLQMADGRIVELVGL